MKLSGFLTIAAFFVGACLCCYQHKQLTDYKSMYERLNGDVQAVFGNERPSEESLANVKDLINSAYETNKENSRLRDETLMLKHHLETMDSDRKEVMSRLIKAHQENRLLQIEIDLLRKTMN